MHLLLKVLAATMLACIADASFASDLVVALVKIKDSRVAENLGPPCEPAPNTLCMSVWARYALRVVHVIAGDEEREVLHAIKIQGGAPYYYEDEAVMVVLEPITDQKKQQTAGASYIIKELLRSSYCFNEPLAQYGLSARNGADKKCHEAWDLQPAGN